MSENAPVPHDPVPEASRPKWLIPLVTVIAAGAYVAAHYPGYRDIQNYLDQLCQQGAATSRCYPGDVEFLLRLVSLELIGFAATAIPAIVLVRIGYRRTFWLPFAAPVFAEAFLTWRFYASTGTLPLTADLWLRPGLLRSSVSLGLALAPAIALVLADKSVAVRTDVPKRASLGLLVSLAAALLCFIPALTAFHDFVVGHAPSAVGTVPNWDWSQLVFFATIFPLGAMLGTRKPWWPWLHIVFALLASGWGAGIVEGWITGSGQTGAAFKLVHIVLPYVAVCLVAASWRSIARRIDRRRPDPSDVEAVAT